jgi:amidophosphoribosyltransferase
MNSSDPFDDDKLREECGVFGIYGHPDAAPHTALGLHALQHRGQEAAGIVTCNGRQFHAHRDLGQVGDIFSSEQVIGRLPGRSAIGHVRYSTTGETALRNVQPLFAELQFGGFALAHNGNLTNALARRSELVERGSLFQSTMDTEVIVHLVATSRAGSVVDRLIGALRQIEGAYSLVGLTDTCVVGVRDPGEMVVLDESGIHSMRPFPPAPRRFCVFEHIYFSRPDSIVEGTSVYEARKRIGAELSRESHVPADVVIPVPDSGVPAAIGYAENAGLPFELGIIRNHYVGRTFIEPAQQIRHLGVKLKHNANRSMLERKRVVLVDDSIVRGTTSIKIVEMVRAVGATEVHMRIAAPPTAHSCFYGIDTPAREELLAARMDPDGMARHIGVDSLAFISLDGLYRAMGEAGRDDEAPQYCDACFTGDYPTRLSDREANAQPAQLMLLAELA